MTQTRTLPLVSPRRHRILAGKLFIPETKSFQTNKVITVNPDSGRIIGVEDYIEHETALSDIDSDLSKYTVLPGFVDVHVHCEYRICKQYQIILTFYFSVPAFVRRNIMGRPSNQREHRRTNNSSYKPCTHHAISRIHFRTVRVLSFPTIAF